MTLIKIFYPYYVSHKEATPILVKELCENLDKTKFELTALTDREMEIKGVRLVRVPTRNFYLKMLSIPLFSLGDFDVIHTGAAYSHVFSRALQRIFRRKTKHLHTLWGASQCPSLAIKILYREADKVLAVSEYVRQEIAINKIGERDVEVIHNGVPIDVFKPIDVPKSETPTVLYVGNLIDYQRPQYVCRLAERMKNVNFVVKGRVIPQTEPSLLEELKRSSQKLKNFTLMTKWLSTQELVELFNRTDIFFQPSIIEGFGLVTAEAMACETPAVGADATATPEVIGETGLLFEPDNLEDAQEKIEKLIENDTLRQNLGKKARERVKTKFSFQKMVKGYSSLYESLVTE